MELHAALREQCPDALPRLVFVTAGAFTPRARAFLDETGVPCLDKPFDLQELRAVARRYVGHDAPRPGEPPPERTPNPLA
jgi:hypothetical protein